MHLIMLSYGEATRVEDYIQHVQHIVCHEILPKETLGEHFERLIGRWEGSPERQKAVTDLINEQDQGFVDLVPWDKYSFGDPEDEDRKYHSFGLRKGDRSG